ncbi:hypothetical protein [uncultured Arcanobacterium sp.]|uniref:hypothetical protein n=1 Tax=uncultured Arcanobacterium sp. TaxID=487520 RepID=UPI002602C289|nr:hypothetical protein [uncultured Arcanobacterium sp.]
MKKIILIGAPGTGKSALAYSLQKYGVQAADIDQLVAEWGIDAAELILDGEAGKLQLAQLEIWEALQADFPPSGVSLVIALPAGIFFPLGADSNSKTTEKLEKILAEKRQKLVDTLGSSDFTVINLTANLSKLVVRKELIGQRSAFILLRRELRLLYGERQNYYQEIANFSFDTSDTTPEIAAAQIWQQLQLENS